MSKRINHLHASPLILSIGLLVLIAFALVIGLSQLNQTQTTGSKAQETAGQYPLSFTEALSDSNYVRTPAGLYHRTCIYDVGDNSTIESDGTVKQGDGVSFKPSTCSYPHFKTDRSSDQGSKTQESTATRSSSNGWVENGWVEEAHYYTEQPIHKLTAKWIVPTTPQTVSGQLIYLFPGLSPSSFNTILQPVLQWGYGGAAGGGTYFAIASWNCDNNCYHSSLKTVKAGDQLLGSMTAYFCNNNDQCQWTVTTTDTTSGVSTTLDTYVVDPMTFVFSGALEVYNLTLCGQYPKTGSTLFTSLAVYDKNLHRLSCNNCWVPQINSVNCSGLKISTSSTNVNLYYGEVGDDCGATGCCTSLGYGSKCQSTGTTCSGGFVDNYCGGGPTWKCCVGASTSCHINHNGKCQTTGGSQSCSSPKSYHSGYCPGPSNVRCCY